MPSKSQWNLTLFNPNADIGLSFTRMTYNIGGSTNVKIWLLICAILNTESSEKLPLAKVVIVLTTSDSIRPTIINAAIMKILSNLLVFLMIGCCI